MNANPTYIPNAIFPDVLEYSLFIHQPLAVAQRVVERALANPVCYRAQTAHLHADIEQLARRAGMFDAAGQLQGMRTTKLPSPDP